MSCLYYRAIKNSVFLMLGLIVFVYFDYVDGVVWGVWFDDALTGELKSPIHVVSCPDDVMDIINISEVTVDKQTRCSNFWAKHGMWVVLGFAINGTLSMGGPVYAYSFGAGVTIESAKLEALGYLNQDFLSRHKVMVVASGKF